LYPRVDQIRKHDMHARRVAERNRIAAQELLKDDS
jgi:hypothetical protein